MKRLISSRHISPALVISCIALFASLSGVSYAVATGSIDGREIKDGSIRNPDFKNGTLRGQEAKRDGFGGGAIKESTLGQVPSSKVADGVSRFGIISAAGTPTTQRGISGVSRSPAGSSGQYQVSFDANVSKCAIVASTVSEPTTGVGSGGQASVSPVTTNGNAVRVVTRNAGGSVADRPFNIIASC